MSASNDGGVHEPQLPQRPPASEGDFARRVRGAVLGGLFGAGSSVVTFMIVMYGCLMLSADIRNDPSFGWLMVGIGLVPIVGAPVGAIFGGAFQGAYKGGVGWGVLGGCIGGVLTGALPLLEAFRIPGK
jgi:hypothetical protein